jgi:thiamine kinase-like enzyme
MVLKVFDSDVSSHSMSKEIEQLKIVSDIEFAPTIVQSNINEKWYEEKYVSGFPPSSYKLVDSDILLKSFKHDIIPCLSKILFYKKPKSIKTSNYISTLIRKLTSSFALLTESQIKGIDKVSYFIYSLEQKLTKKSNPDIYLAFSHGDFCPANMLTTEEGLIILDWESAGYRSALYDFFSYFFYRPACINHPVDEMFQELNESLQLFLDSPTMIRSSIKNNVSSLINEYRRIFYLEMLCILLQRHTTDKNLNILDFILRYIDAFNSYEKILKYRCTLTPTNSTVEMNT